MPAASDLMISGRRQEEECDRQSETTGDKEARRVIESFDWELWLLEQLPDSPTPRLPFHACIVNPGVTPGDNFTR